MEDVLVSANAALPVTVLRPGAISGPGSVHPRELWFVKRALDHRPVQLLNWGGQSQFHTSSTVNIAELVRLAATQPARRVLNAVDPKASTTTEIGSRINEILDHHPVEFVVPGSPGVGDTPWSVPKPFVMDMSEAVRDLGYKPAMGYAEAMDEDRARLLQIDGAMPRLNAIPRGCAFNPRCPQVFGRCLVDRPDLLPAGATRAACWLHAERDVKAAA